MTQYFAVMTEMVNSKNLQKGSGCMSEKEKKILETFGKVIPDLSEMEKEKLLSFGEGMAFMKDKQKKKKGEKKDE